MLLLRLPTLTTADWGLAISILALLISAWTRVETFLHLRRQHRTDLARRLGEALATAQQTKNQLSETIDVVKNLIRQPGEQPAAIDVYKAACSRMEQNYTEIWNLIEAMEAISIAFEQGMNAPLNPAVVEAKIGRLNQIRVLAQHDCEFAEKQLSMERRREI
jgi:hypothetical protein